MPHLSPPRNARAASATGPILIAFALSCASSPNGSNPDPGGSAGSLVGSGGAGGGTAGSPNEGGSTSGGAAVSTGGGGTPAMGGVSGSAVAATGGAGQAGLGGAAVNGGTNSGAGAGGSAGASAKGPFVCNQVTAMTLTREWFDAGFQLDAGIVDDRWQLKAREHGYITEWANPSSDFWNQALESPCAAGSENPDHVVLTVLSWNPACCTTQPEWETPIAAAVTNLRSKYSALKRVDLMTVIRGPGNQLCPTPPAAAETIVIPPELDAALAATATKFAGLVFVAPKFEAPNCAAFNGGGPHLTTAGNTAVARDIAAYFASFQ